MLNLGAAGAVSLIPSVTIGGYNMTKAAVSLSGRDILDLSSLSVEEYDLIMTCSMKTAPGPGVPSNWPGSTWAPT